MFELINENEIKRAIKRCKSNNASNSNDISNRLLKVLVNKLISHFLSLFQVCVELNYHSLCFRKTHIIALKKSKKKNYTNVKTYKSIVLLNIFDKTLKSIIAQRINDLTKTHDLLSINQMSERRNRSCETTLKLFIEQIHTVWNMNKNKMISFLSMNVVEIYDHVSKARLLHNLRKKRILTWIIVWTNNFMQDRRITFVINSDTTTVSNVNVDISQNFFVSFILYLFYNADLLKLLKRSFRRIAALDFVNDINILTYEFNITSNCRILKEMHAHCETWTRRHEIVFASIKYELIHLTRNSRKFDMQTIVRICDVVKQSFNQIRFLKMQIDIKLKWRTHVKSIQKKMITQTLTLSRLIAFIWEACFVKTRLIYKTIIKSAVIYASIIWHASHDRSDSVVDTTTKFIKMQQQCLKIIHDSFKTMSTQILEVEIYVKLIQLHLAHLQIKFRQRMKKKQHDVLIFNFCNRIKSRLTTQRDRRRRRAVKTSNEKKQKWSTKLAKKMRKKNKMNEESIEKTWHKLFRVKWQQTWNAYQTKNRRRVCETLTNDISSKRLKLHKVLTKSESAFVTHMRTRRIELVDYLFFRRVFIVLLFDCFCDYSRQTLKHVLLFCMNRATNKQRMFKIDETTNLRKLLNIEKRFKTSINWLMKINLLIQFSLIKKCLK